MSFDPAFDARWSTVLQPALKCVVLENGIPLDPFRVDLSRSSDAILTEVLQAIADSAVIIADITALHELNRRPVRNGNVMYEVGLAHAARLPEEVLLFRSDSLRWISILLECAFILMIRSQIPTPPVRRLRKPWWIRRKALLRGVVLLCALRVEDSLSLRPIC
jgi:hypothetical protein